MAIGQITSFPINTILEFATSAQHGLCPQLSGYIHDDILDCDVNTPVSEAGIRIALNSTDDTIGYTNLGTGYPIFATLDAPTAYYNVLSAISNYVTGFISNGTLFLSAYGDPTSGTSAIVSGDQPLSVQGGKYQYSNTISGGDIETAGYIISDTVQDDVLAKTFIKCTVPFEQNGSTYSIGVSSDTFENKTLITNIFEAPSAAGLVPFTYSDSMSAEYYWLNSPSELRIYRYGSAVSYGEIGISTFYDNVVWAPSYGYVMGYFEIGRLNLVNETYTTRAPTVFVIYGSSAKSYNYFIYNLGGQTGSTAKNNITKYDTKNDTVSPSDKGDLTLARTQGSAGKSAIKVYYIGGMHYAGGLTSVTTIEYLQFSNDTANAIANANLTTPKGNAGTLSTTTKVYMAGGENWSAGSLLNSANDTSIEDMAFATDTITAVLVAVLSIGRAYTVPLEYGTTYGYYINGTYKPVSLTWLVRDVIDRFAYSTETVTTLSISLPILVTESTPVQKTTDGYIMGGLAKISPIGVGYSGFASVDTIQKFNFATETTSIINEVIDVPKSTVAGASV